MDCTSYKFLQRVVPYGNNCGQEIFAAVVSITAVLKKPLTDSAVVWQFNEEEAQACL